MPRQSTKIIRPCETCGKALHLTPCTISRRFCSRKCEAQARTIPLSIRFQKYVGPTTDKGCILWIGRTMPFGYGVIDSGTSKGQPVLAHRVAYEIANGAISDGLFICHTCDNPRCVNPDHLFLGTPQDNVDDMISKGRIRVGSKENGRHPRLAKSDVRAIRDRHASGNTTVAKLASEYGIHQQTVRLILRRKTWKHI